MSVQSHQWKIRHLVHFSFKAHKKSLKVCVRLLSCRTKFVEFGRRCSMTNTKHEPKIVLNDIHKYAHDDHDTMNGNCAIECILLLSPPKNLQRKQYFQVKGFSWVPCHLIRQFFSVARRRDKLLSNPFSTFYTQFFSK